MVQSYRCLLKREQHLKNGKDQETKSIGDYTEKAKETWRQTAVSKRKVWNDEAEIFRTAKQKQADKKKYAWTKTYQR